MSQGTDVDRPLNLAIIIGSTREGRFGDTVGRWFAKEAARHGGFAIDVIDLIDITLPPSHRAKPTPEVDAFRKRLAAADAFVIVTPEYNHSYPASLKHAIDQAYAEWMAKPVGFVSYGGTVGGVRAIEHLRHVFAELHATAKRGGSSMKTATRSTARARAKPPRSCWTAWPGGPKPCARRARPGPMSKAREDRSALSGGALCGGLARFPDRLGPKSVSS